VSSANNQSLLLALNQHTSTLSFIKWWQLMKLFSHLWLFKNRYMVHPDRRGWVVDNMFRGGSEQCLCLTELHQAGMEDVKFCLIDLWGQVLCQTAEWVQKTLTPPLREQTHMFNGGLPMTSLKDQRPTWSVCLQ